LVRQTYQNFEVVIVEDGSSNKCDAVSESFSSKLNIRYFYKPNAGQGFARNYGFERAQGEYFVVLDSDALLPDTYLETVENQLNTSYLDIFGGPDTDHPSFTPIQKAISYSMTSVFTTGGIRGKSNNMGGTFHPRSFNMGLSREVWNHTQGFKITRMGEDIEFSIRAISLGFKSGLIADAYIYHKRRTSFSQFYKQLHFFGRARINISRFFPSELKLVHIFPMMFLLALLATPLLFFINKTLFVLALAGFGLYSMAILIDASIRNKNLWIGLLSVRAAFTQLAAYGMGFLEEAWQKFTVS
jgi:glycosyltransferase involved in cell wall biosynthesis